MYRLEIFSEKMVYISSSLIEEQPIELDYLTFDAFTITSVTVACKKGYLVHITSGENLVVDGVISDVKPGKGTVDISIRPLQSIFDVSVFKSDITDVSAWIYGQISEQFINNSDTLQNRPISASYESAPSTPISIDKNDVKITDVMASALTTYGIVCDCTLNMRTMLIDVYIHAQNSTAVIEADLLNTIDKTITLGDSYGEANKAIIRKVVTDSATGEVTYPTTEAFYLHTDGTVSSTNSDRITPVVCVLKDVPYSETWEADALSSAAELLTPKQYDNEIVLKYKTDDMIVHPNEMEIGTKTTIMLDGNSYGSILTGKNIYRGEIELVFGCVRLALTKRLILERRK